MFSVVATVVPGRSSHKRGESTSMASSSLSSLPVGSRNNKSAAGGGATKRRLSAPPQSAPLSSKREMAINRNKTMEFTRRQLSKADTTTSSDEDDDDDDDDDADTFDEIAPSRVCGRRRGGGFGGILCVTGKPDLDEFAEPPVIHVGADALACGSHDMLLLASQKKRLEQREAAASLQKRARDEHVFDRWKSISQQAGGCHQVDPSLLDLSFRCLPPQALQYGVPPRVAAVVTDLRFNGNSVGRHELPAFLDLATQLFPKLKHLSLEENPCRETVTKEDSPPSSMQRLLAPENLSMRRLAYPEEPVTRSASCALPTSPTSAAATNAKDGSPPAKEEVDKVRNRIQAAIDAADRESVRMQRLYILYRLPQLLSIDGVPVSMRERELARPASFGQRVRRGDWIWQSSPSSVAPTSALQCRTNKDRPWSSFEVVKPHPVHAHMAAKTTAAVATTTTTVSDKENRGRVDLNQNAVEVSFCGKISVVSGHGNGSSPIVKHYLSSSSMRKEETKEEVQAPSSPVFVAVTRGDACKGTVMGGVAKTAAPPVLPKKLPSSRPPPSPHSTMRNTSVTASQQSLARRRRMRRAWRTRRAMVMRATSMMDEDEEDEDEEEESDDEEDEDDYFQSREEVEVTGMEGDTEIHWIRSTAVQDQ